MLTSLKMIKKLSTDLQSLFLYYKCLLQMSIAEIDLRFQGYAPMSRVVVCVATDE
jgi:hypothetical protein